MAVNARTFEILYIVRQRAQEDLTTTFDDFGDFIAERRKAAPDIYGKAYIAPSALVPLLQRMTTGDNLLTLDPPSGVYEFTPQGSQMADLLEDMDACSTFFMDNYKAKVCLAVLRQRWRLNQGPASPREVAAISNISLDSARRGLTSLAQLNEVIEDRSGRTPVYYIDPPPQAAVEEDEVEDTDAAFEAEIEKAARKGLDIAAALSEIDEDDEGWATTEEAEDEGDNILPLPLGKILQDDGPDEAPDPFQFELDNSEDELESMEMDPYAWGSVPDDVREGLITQARACGMCLTEYLNTITVANQNRLAVALRHTVKFG